MLLFHTKTPGQHIPAPLLISDTHISVSGPVARVIVKQVFFNPSKKWIEGRYVFPLPENAAVSHMVLKTGEQVIVSEIREKQAARKIFGEARKSGRRAALIEQHRPNMFSNEVANIPPGKSVSVTMTYLQRIRFDQGSFRLRYPMVVAPRYQPGKFFGVRNNEPVPQSKDTFPVTPVLHPDAGSLNPVRLKVTLNAGIALNSIESDTHAIRVTKSENGVAEIVLRKKVVAADRDFELVWTPARGTEPALSLFREKIGGEYYFLATILPPRPDATKAPPAREVIFILDRSGSMGGQSIRQARAALNRALRRLRPIDRFNIIRFSDKTDSLFARPVRASSTDIGHATAWIANTDAEGGTEMMSALHRALAGKPKDGLLRQIVFLTDGAISNESALFDLIARNLGKARLFPVGIGSAPNSHFMRRAAALGRGSFTHISDLSQVSDRITGLLRKLEQPLTTDLTASFTGLDDADIEVTRYPGEIPDLYDGEPLELAIRILGAKPFPDPACLIIEGRNAGADWKKTLHLKDARDGKGIGTVWGRTRIEALEMARHMGADPESVRLAITSTALRHKIVSKYTSLVAVARQADRRVDEPVFKRDIPRNLPDGWEYDKLFGGQLKASAAIAPASLRMNAQRARQPLALPTGGTDSILRLIAGLAALLLGTVLMLRRRAG